MHVYDTFEAITLEVVKRDGFETRLSPILHAFQTEVLVDKLELINCEVERILCVPKVTVNLVEPKQEDGDNPIRSALLWVTQTECDFDKEANNAIELSSLLQGAPVKYDVNGISVTATALDTPDHLYKKFLADTKKYGHGFMGANDTQAALRAILSEGSTAPNSVKKAIIGLFQ